MTAKDFMQGCFITFEGIDGAGKSTHVGACVDWLRAQGETVVPSREPGGSPLAERLRELLLTEEMQPQTEALLAFAARSAHLHTLLRPAPAAGPSVVRDRLTDSTLSSPGGGSDVDTAWLAQLEAHVQDGLQPVRTYLFDLPPEVAAARRAAVRSADRFEARALDYFERVRRAYQARVAADPERFCVLDATATPEQIGRWLQDDLVKVHRRWREKAASPTGAADKAGARPS